MRIDLRILMLVQSSNIKGPLTKITPLLVDTLRSEGCQVITQLWGRHSDQEMLYQKIFSRSSDLYQVWHLLKNHSFDILFIQSAHNWRPLCRDIPLLLLSRHLVPKVVTQLHGSHSERLVGTGYRLFKQLSKLLVSLSDAVLVLSTEELHQWQLFYPKSRFYFVNNPYLANQKIVTKENLWDIPDGTPVLLFVGRLEKEKGIFDLLNAMPLILAQVKCHLLIAGDGKQAKLVQGLIKQGLSAHVTLTGYLNKDCLSQAYQQANIFVLPSYHAEGFPTVIAEAMDDGLPIVTTFVRGAADHLVPEVNALFIPPRDPVNLAAALLRLLKDPELRAKMGKANREKVKIFSPEKAVKIYLKVFQDVMQSIPAPR